MNLVLEVLGKRDDGYHEIATVFHAVDLADRVTLEEADDVELVTAAPDVPADGTNLAVRAAVALREAARIDRGVRIGLDKRIPVAAGLGGGSSDAAAVLVGLDTLWRLRWGPERLAEVAVALGMDVPFFLGSAGAAVGTGRGERLAPMPGAGYSFVLVNPGEPVSTADTYRGVSPDMYSDGSRARAMVQAVASSRAARVAAGLYNALEAVVARRCAAIARMRAALLAAGALGAVMSGSGPTVFGIARSFEHARQIRRRLTRASWRCWAVRGLCGAPVRTRTK